MGGGGEYIITKPVTNDHNGSLSEATIQPTRRQAMHNDRVGF